MTQVTGALTLELDLDRLAEKVALRVVELLAGQLPGAGNPDPHQGGGEPGRGAHTNDELGLGGLAETTTPTPEELS